MEKTKKIMQTSKQEIGDYLILQTIGSGSSGKVKLAEHKETHALAAIKIFKKSLFGSKPELEQKIQRETALMRILDHPHLLKLKEFCESPKHIFIVLEYAAHGELFDYLMARRALPFEVAMKFFRQIIYGLDYLHSNNICHRDLKPENILLDENDNIKIADFGFARWMCTDTTETSCGSPHYVSPEIVKGIPYDGRKADIWSCGVILYALLSGRLPFDDPSYRNLIQKVKTGQYRMPDFPAEIKDLISRMLQVDPNKRITIEQIKHHKAFRNSLPKNFSVPTPLPWPAKIDPIDPDDVDHLVLDVLYNIGFSKDNVGEMLKENGFNQAKYFCLLLSQKLSLESLPWTTIELNDSSDAKGEKNDNESNFYIENNAQLGIGGSLGLKGADQFARKKFSESNSMRVYSMIEKAEVYGPILESQEKRMETIESISFQLEVVFGEIQNFLINSGYDWFYPNEMTLYTHKENVECQAYYTLQAIYENDEQFSLTVKVQGSDNNFDIFLQQLTTLISNISV